MLIIPAIDIKEGKCVRLKQGDFADKTVYFDHPEEVAARFQKFGAQKLHIVDLDGAESGNNLNKQVIEKIRGAFHQPIELGGGIRTLENIKSWLDLGIDEVIISTMAIKNPDMFAEALAQFGGDKIILAADAKDGKVAVHGWQEVSEITATDLSNQFKLEGLQRVLYTDISRDGMFTGPNIEATQKLAETTGLKVTASGGVSSLKDIENLRGIETSGVDSVVVGKALYEGKIQPEEIFHVG